MNSILLTNANSSSTEVNKLTLRLRQKMTLKDSLIALGNLTLYYSWFNIKEEYGNNTLSYSKSGEVTDVTLPDGSYSIQDINNYLHHIMKQNQDTVEENEANIPSGGVTAYPINLYPNSVYNRISILISDGYTLQLGEGMAKTLGFSNRNITASANGDLVPNVERVETVLVHTNLVENAFVVDSSILYSFTPDKPFGYLLNVKPSFPRWCHTRNSEFSEVSVWFTDQEYRPLEIEDPKITVDLLIKPRNLI